MNLKTTIFLILLVAAGIGGGIWLNSRKPIVDAPSRSLDFLQNELVADKIQRIEVSRQKPLKMPAQAMSLLGLLGSPAGQVPLLASAALCPRIEAIFSLQKTGKGWSLPGNWPIRSQEAEQWIDVLTSLQSRFVPMPLDAGLKKKFGLEDEDALLVQVTLDGKTHVLRFGEEESDSRRFARPTYVCVDDDAEIIRLGSGVLAALDRKLEHFQRRRLFEVERVAKEEDGKDRVDQIAAEEMVVETATEKIAFARKDKEWIVKYADHKFVPLAASSAGLTIGSPLGEGALCAAAALFPGRTLYDPTWRKLCAEDQIDPGKRRALLSAFPDLWAEKFVRRGDRPLDYFGLQEPEYSLTVRRTDGTKIKLLIGKIFDTKTRMVGKPTPPQFGQPPKAPEFVTDVFRYAMLEGNEQLFEIKANQLDDVTAPLDALRDPRLARFKEKNVKRLEIKHGNQDIVFVKVKQDDKEKWRFEKPGSEDADTEQVEGVLKTLANLQVKDRQIFDEADPKKFGLDKPFAFIKITLEDDKEGEKKLREMVLRIGGDAKDKDHLYVRVDSWPRINQVGAELEKLLERKPLDYLDKTLLSIDAKEIQRLTMQGRVSFALIPVQGNWQVVDSPAPPFTADSAAVASTLRVWDRLRAEKIAAYGPGIDWAHYGLDKPAETIKVQAKADEDDKTKKGAEHLLALGKAVEGGGRYARLDEKDAVVVLDAGTVKNLTRTHLDFVDPLVLQYDAETLVEIHRQMKGADLELLKQDDQWRILRPFSRDADNLAVAALVDKTFRLRANRIAAYPASDLSAFGLDQPHAVVTLVLDVAGMTKKHLLKVGAVVKESKESKEKDAEERYALIDGGAMVVVLPADLSRSLVAPVLFYADRNLASFSGIDHVVLKRGQRSAVFVLADKNWQMTAPIKAGAEDAALNDLIRSVQRLRADEIVSDKEADAKKYGLDAPWLQWLFRSGDSEKLLLIIGNAENDGPGARRYAKIGGKDEIFLLGPKLTAKVSDEYRSRKPWPALEADEIERLTIQKNSDKPFRLRKSGASWIVEDEPGVKINAKKVAETLDALASLRALRYVADTKADLGKYGLLKPSWKIELQTPNGKRELWLGDTEEKSPRFYATLPGSDAVFVLDEAEGARIARSLPAFSEPEKKKAIPPF